MTAISSLAAVVTVPLFLELATDHFGARGLDEDVSMLGVVARVLLITVIPLSFGMWLRGAAWHAWRRSRARFAAWRWRSSPPSWSA